MREPERIDEILAALRAIWVKYPDWRFGQLVMNMSRVDGVVQHPDLIWNKEDDWWLRQIVEFVGDDELSDEELVRRVVKQGISESDAVEMVKAYRKTGVV